VFLESPQHKFKPVLWPLATGNYLPSFPPSLHGSDLWIKESGILQAVVSTQTVPECLGVFLESPQHKFKPVLWPLRRATICQVSRLRCTDQTFGSKKVVFCGLSYRPKLFLSVWCVLESPQHKFKPVLWPLATGNYLPSFPPSLHGSDLWIKKVVFCGLSYRPKLFLSVWCVPGISPAQI